MARHKEAQRKGHINTEKEEDKEMSLRRYNPVHTSVLRQPKLYLQHNKFILFKLLGIKYFLMTIPAEGQRIHNRLFLPFTFTLLIHLAFGPVTTERFGTQALYLSSVVFYNCLTL